MHDAKRLVTSIDVDHAVETQLEADLQLNITALLELEHTGGRRVTLLDDRGWASSGPSNIWSFTSPEDMVQTACGVVGPDEPPEGRS